jgi:hypothetical protein
MQIKGAKMAVLVAISIAISDDDSWLLSAERSVKCVTVAN